MSVLSWLMVVGWLGIVGSWVGTGVVRSVVHRRREGERERGIGGTQDIAMMGTGVMAVFLVVNVVGFVGWQMTRERGRMTETGPAKEVEQER